MRHFISFQKRKGLFVESNESKNSNNSQLIHQFNHELMKYGYFLSKDLFDTLSDLHETEISQIYTDLITNIVKVIGDGKHEPIYRNFPQSVLALSYKEFVINAIMHYWSFGTWRPEDIGYIKREFKLEAVNYKKIDLLTKAQFDSIFTDIIYSGASINKFDKQIVDYFISQNTPFDLSKISFKETLAYIGKRLLDGNLTILPTKDAVNVLRIYSAYCGGDEGLKVNTKFKNPTSKQVKLLANTLDKCYNLEEGFKINREKFLRLLFYLNPLTKANKVIYPTLANYAGLLRNNPKELRTFNSRVEELLGKKDLKVFDLLKKRPKAFMRRLDHTVRIFGAEAINYWLSVNTELSSLITAYNHFTDRDKKQDGRGAILASQEKSNVVTYEGLEPLPTEVVSAIKNTLLEKIRKAKLKNLTDKKVFIDRSLYYRPLTMNNRAASLSLDGKTNGTVEVAPAGKTIRMYVHWHGRHDIDLSGLVLTNDGGYSKVGWNGRHHLAESIVYSGDNTGYASQNAEYLDITVNKLPKNIEWVIVDARIFRGPKNFASFSPKTKIGWMIRTHPDANQHWLPETVEHAAVLNNTSTTAYLMALHVPTRSIVYLDMGMGSAQISGEADALKMRMFLESFITLDKGEDEIKWEKINQGHVLNVISMLVVSKKEEADVVFDENTTTETVTGYLNSVKVQKEIGEPAIASSVFITEEV